MVPFQVTPIYGIERPQAARFIYGKHHANPTTPSFYQTSSGQTISTPEIWTYVQQLENHRSQIEATISELQPYLHPTQGGSTSQRFYSSSNDVVLHLLDRFRRVYPGTGNVPSHIDNMLMPVSQITTEDYGSIVDSVTTRADAEPEDDNMRPSLVRNDRTTVETVSNGSSQTTTSEAGAKPVVKITTYDTPGDDDGKPHLSLHQDYYRIGIQVQEIPSTTMETSSGPRLRCNKSVPS